MKERGLALDFFPHILAALGFYEKKNLSGW